LSRVNTLGRRVRYGWRFARNGLGNGGEGIGCVFNRRRLRNRFPWNRRRIG
jgi:hypothetical protein